MEFCVATAHKKISSSLTDEIVSLCGWKLSGDFSERQAFWRKLRRKPQSMLRTSVFKSALDLLGFRDISLANWGNVAFRDQRG